MDLYTKNEENQINTKIYSIKMYTKLASVDQSSFIRDACGIIKIKLNSSIFCHIVYCENGENQII